MRSKGKPFWRAVSLLAVLLLFFLFSRKDILGRFLPGFVGTSGKEEVVIRSFSFEDKKSVEEWEEKALVSKKTEYFPTEHMGRSCLKAVSDGSASTLFFKQKLFHERWPYVSWDWLVEKFPERQDEETLDRKKEFDFAAQVYVVFYSRFFLKRKAIQYVWAEDLPVGEVADNPYTSNVKLMVLESGLSAEWRHEDRNIREDYRKLFGEELGKDIDTVAFMTDSDSTGSSAVAYYTDIALKFSQDPGGDPGSGAGGRAELFERLLGWLPRDIFTKKEGKEEPSDT
jgi:hypothetical protein